jgi:hypothetical protein
MRALLFSLSLFAILAVGCEKPAEVGKDAPAKSGGDTAVTEKAEKAGDGLKLDEVDAEGLEAVLASNDITLLDFTAVW